eukprot:CAMPEP_0113599050 /NCGR_PEP_ID=MMETSP0015_2-20120614/41926_1 /TAXON_ID=2838 /ORGANISM="Odontella" /LENGTH=443 /DNA_ID=CAMNT_0000507133 /DNA_START=131 /DNA_END=1457 /DNA_ORIENTATION=- /assembly_acc=CAM_ASM_000160
MSSSRGTSPIPPSEGGGGIAGGSDPPPSPSLLRAASSGQRRSRLKMGSGVGADLKSSGIQKPAFRSPDAVAASASSSGIKNSDYGPAKDKFKSSGADVDGSGGGGLEGGSTPEDSTSPRAGRVGGSGRESGGRTHRLSGIQKPAFKSPEKPAFKSPPLENTSPSDSGLGFKSPDTGRSGIQRPSFHSPDKSPTKTAEEAASVLADYRQRRSVFGSARKQMDDGDGDIARVSVKVLARELAAAGAPGAAGGATDATSPRSSTPEQRPDLISPPISPTKTHSPSPEKQPAGKQKHSSSPPKSSPQFTSASSPPVSAIRVPNTDGDTVAAAVHGAAGTASWEGSGNIPTLPEEEPSSSSPFEEGRGDDAAMPIRLAKLDMSPSSPGTDEPEGSDTPISGKALGRIRSPRSDDYLSPVSADSSEASDLRDGLDNHHAEGGKEDDEGP